MKIRFSLWCFLNQPIFSSKTKLILNPRLFTYVHRVKLLERCWTQEYDFKGRQHRGDS
jgi:hypothetical protein